MGREGVGPSRLCASPADAPRAGGTPRQTETQLIRLGDELKPDGVELQVRDEKVVGVTVVKPGGGRLALSQQSEPACAGGCPAG